MKSIQKGIRCTRLRKARNIHNKPRDGYCTTLKKLGLGGGVYEWEVLKMFGVLASLMVQYQGNWVFTSGQPPTIKHVKVN